MTHIAIAEAQNGRWSTGWKRSATHNTARDRLGTQHAEPR
jgi:hypothetical protein